jgi:hypothetical protein
LRVCVLSLRRLKVESLFLEAKGNDASLLPPLPYVFFDERFRIGHDAGDEVDPACLALKLYR